MKYDVMFFDNGNTAVFNDGQVPELQQSWLRLYVSFLQEHGIDPEDCKFSMPGAEPVFAKWDNESNNWSLELGGR